MLTNFIHQWSDPTTISTPSPNTSTGNPDSIKSQESLGIDPEAMRGSWSALRMPGAYPYAPRRRREACWRARRRDESQLKHAVAGSQRTLDQLRRRNAQIEREVERLRQESTILDREVARLKAENELKEQRRRREKMIGERLDAMEAQLRAQRLQQEERIRQEEERLHEQERHYARQGTAQDGQHGGQSVKQSFENYEAKWRELRAGLQLDRLLDASELPWPVHDIRVLINIKDSPDNARSAVEAFVLDKERPGFEDKSSRRRLHDELLRWHPDKFTVRVLHLVKEHQRQDTLGLAEQITVFLTDILANV